MKEIDEDGGFKRHVVPQVAYQFRDIWGENIRINERYVRDGIALRRDFKPADLDRIEGIMRLMIVALDK